MKSLAGITGDWAASDRKEVAISQEGGRAARAQTLSFRRRLLYSLLPVMLLVGAGELAARTWLYGFAPPQDYRKYAVPSEFPTAAKYAPHHYLCYTLQPNYRHEGTTHNSQGFRGREIVIPKPKAVFRIAILGGSTTYGEFINADTDTFPAQLETILREEFGYTHVEVINAGVPGYSSWESLGNLSFRVLDFEPDLVIPYEGVNDVHARIVMPAAYRGDNAGRRTIWTEPVEVQLCKHSVLARVLGHHLGLWRLPGVDSFVQAPTSDPGTHGPSRAIGGEPMRTLDANPPIYTARNLRNMAAIARANGAKVMFATWAHSSLMGDYSATPHYERGFNEHNETVKEMAAELQAPCFDFAAQMPADREFWRDGRHVNAKGARLQAEMFAKSLHAHSFIRR